MRTLPYDPTGRTPAWRPVCIVGTGSYLPEKILTNAELATMVDTSDEWITTRTGIKTRHVGAPEQASSDLAAEATNRALVSAGIDAAAIDLIVVATVTPDMPFPSTACYLQKHIGAVNAACFDLNAACSGFLYALETARQFISSGSANTALVVGVDKLTSVTDWKDRATCVLFGDGAGAVILQSRPGTRGIITSALYADGNLNHLLNIPGGGSRQPASEATVRDRLHYIKMAGKEVFKYAVNAMLMAANQSLEQAGLSIDQIACIIPHQANLRIIQAIGDRLGAPLEKYFINLERYGNMSAATIPVALDEAAHAGKLKKGDLVLMVAFGGGFTWASIIVEW